MRIKSARSLKELSEVLMDKNSKGPDPAYWVLTDIPSPRWKNITLTSPGNYNGELVKTYGHYHSSDTNETYKLISGQGVLLVQKRKFIDDDFAEDIIETVYFIEFLPEDELIITPEWGHSFINLGNEPLVTYDDWSEPHKESDYKAIKKLNGMSYYLILKNNKPEFVKNPNYKEVPIPKWISVSELGGITQDL